MSGLEGRIVPDRACPECGSTALQVQVQTVAYLDDGTVRYVDRPGALPFEGAVARCGACERVFVYDMNEDSFYDSRGVTS
jgi:hypothetical protein